MHKLIIMPGIILAGVLGFSSSAFAVSAGDWLIRFGTTTVAPNVKSGDLSGSPGGKVDVNDNTQLSVNLTYMLSNNIGVEVIAATPFSHDIEGAGVLNGAGKVAEVKQLPPTFMLQYHLSPGATTRPYVGAGLNYTFFFDEETTGALTGTDISLDDSFGLALQAGVDMDISKDWFINADIRYINIETTATTALGTVDVDLNPWVYTISAGMKF